MKKFTLLTLAIGLFAFTSCSSDDDGGDGGNSDCVVCSMSMEGNSIDTEYCDNGDGTMTVTVRSGGQEVSQDQDIPEGTTFDEIISEMEQNGENCN